MRGRRPSRSSNPLLVASAALTRAIDPAKPSRITVIRLLGDALHALKESQLTADAIRLRSSSYASRDHPERLNRIRIEADSRFRAAHEQGARSLFSAAVSTLLKLPCRAGPLRRRAIDIIYVAGRAAGPAVAMQAVDRVRSHISGLKKLSWSDSETSDFEVSSAVLTLADLSNCMIAGRDVARESILFLLSQRVRQRSRRNDLAHAIAHIVQSIPHHAPPDDRLVDDILEFCFSSASVKQGTAGFGTALLTAVIVPFMVSRGPAPADEVVSKSAKALRLSPTSTERSMWALALVRASVTARRSTTYQLHKYGTSDMTSKFPRDASSGGPIKFSNDAAASNAAAWVSNEIFEESLFQVSNVTGLPEGKLDATIAVAGVLRMWAQALPDTTPIIIPRAFGKLFGMLQSVAAVSALVDAIALGVLKHLKPSISSQVLENLLPALEEHGLPLAAALHVCSIVLAIHGRQALRETGLTVDYKHLTTTMIKRSLDTVEFASPAVRFGSVRLMSSIIAALPRTCSHFLTSVLQNLRIADLALATKEVTFPKRHNPDTNYKFEIGEPELSCLLGNAAALAMLIEKVSTKVCSVPNALLRQCAIDSAALLHPHHAREEGNAFGPVAFCVRRRAGWGLVAAMAKGRMKTMFEDEALTKLIALWKEDLGFAIEKSSVQEYQVSTLQHYPTPSIWEMTESISTSSFEEVVARSSMRSAALFALICAFKNVYSTQLEDCAKTFVGSSAARITAAMANLQVSPPHGSAQSSSGRLSFAIDQIPSSDSIRKKYVSHLAKVLTVEAVHLAQCIYVVPPRGDCGELCYNVCVALVEEAQRVLGEGDTSYNVDPTLTHGSSSQKPCFDSALANKTPSLHRVSTPAYSGFASNTLSERKSDSARASRDAASCGLGEREWSWLFGKQGVYSPNAESTFTDAARGVAAVMAEDLVESGTLIENLSSAKLSPTFSAIVALEMAKRMSHSDLAEVNRVLAVLQLLTRNSLGIPGGCQKSIASQTKAGRLYTPSSHGDGICSTKSDIPGSYLHQMAKSGSWLSWTRVITDEADIARAPFQNFHTRAFATMIATRTIAAEAYRELSVTGGAPLWVGMMRKVISLVRDNITSSTPTQSVILSSSLATLGALLEVIPEKQNTLDGTSRKSAEYQREFPGCSLDEISAEAVEIIASSIEDGKTDVQAAASLALSSCSHRVASSSERILAGLLRAWSEDKGDFRSLGHFGKYRDEAETWSLCFLHIWSDMGIRELGNRTRFYCHDSHGTDSTSSIFVTGASAVLASCKLHWWPLSESSFLTVKEMSTELLQWHGETSERARVAGLRGMTALWAAKTDSAQAKQLTVVARESPGWSKKLSGHTMSVEDVPAVPIDQFSLKESSRIASPVGPFLDEVLYGALAPSEEMEGLYDLQDAACGAVSELFRGGSVEVVSTNLPRLPETLFAAFDRGIVEARRLLKMLVQQDAVKRPRYWFGLCRAICLNNERLNYGQGRSTWDLSLRTKSFTVSIASEVVHFSLASCTCFSEEGHRQGSELTVSHNCAHSFLRKIIDFAKQVCRGDGFDYRSCREACRLLQRVVSKFKPRPEMTEESMRVLRDFKAVWTSCVPILQKLITDQVPHEVLHAAAEALCEELILGLRLQRRNAIRSSLWTSDTVFSFLELGSALSIKDRFEYLDQGEEVGIHAVFSMLATCGRLLSALRVSLQSSSNVFKTRMSTSGMPERLLFAICGDFVSTLHGDGLHIMARDGGSLTSGTAVKSSLQKSLFAFVAPIVLGSVSCFGFGSADINVSSDDGFWENTESPGVRMSTCGHRDEVIVTSALVWLLMHEHGDAFKKAEWTSYHSQCREAVESLCCSEKHLDQVTKEALIGFCNWDKIAFLDFAKELAGLERLADFMREFLIELNLSVVMMSASNDLEDADSVDVQTFRKAFISLSELLMRHANNFSRERQSAKILDVLFSFVEQANSATVSVLTSPEVLQSLCELFSLCATSNKRLRSKPKLYFALFKCLCFSGIQSHSTADAKLGAALCASLCSVSVCSQQYFVEEILISSCLLETNKGVCNYAIRTLLEVPGVENIIIQFISSISTEQNLHNCQSVVSLLTALGVVALDDVPCSIGAALKCAIAAVLVDGECAPVVNKLGVILYTALLSRLVFSLPMSTSSVSGTPISSDEAYLLSLLQEDNTSVHSLASSLHEDERHRIAEFIIAWEESHSDI